MMDLVFRIQIRFLDESEGGRKHPVMQRVPLTSPDRGHGYMPLFQFDRHEAYWGGLICDFFDASEEKLADGVDVPKNAYADVYSIHKEVTASMREIVSIGMLVTLRESPQSVIAAARVTHVY